MAVPHDLSGIPELIHGTINNPSSLYEMGLPEEPVRVYDQLMLEKIGWLEHNNSMIFILNPKSQWPLDSQAQSPTSQLWLRKGGDCARGVDGEPDDLAVVVQPQPTALLHVPYRF